MIRKTSVLLAALALALGMTVTAAPAQAKDTGWDIPIQPPVPKCWYWPCPESS